MQSQEQAVLLRVFTGEADKIGHTPVYEIMVQAARENELAGATIIRGIMSFGASTVIHTAQWIDISQDLPIIIEIVDVEKKINDFIPVINEIFAKSKRGGLITTEKVNVIFYQPNH